VKIAAGLLLHTPLRLEARLSVDKAKKLSSLSSS